MRLPFLKIQQDAFMRAKLAGGYLRTSRREALGMAADLWAWGVDMTPEGIDPGLIGCFFDDDPAGVLAAALEWRDGPDALFSAFVRAGFIEPLHVAVGDSDARKIGGFRIKGLRDLYGDALGLPSKRSEAGKKGAAARWQSHDKPIANLSDADAPPTTTDGQTQKQTQTQTQRQETNDVRPPAATGFPVVPEKPDKPDGLWDGMDFWAWAQAKRREAGLQTERRPNDRTVSVWWSQALMQGSTPKALRNAFVAFGRDPYWTSPERKPPIPFNGFISQWERFVSPEDTNASA
jgi:hypothetical protein